MASPLYGVLSMRVDGDALSISGEWTYDVGGRSREEVMGADGVVGFKVTPMPSYFEGTVFDHPDTNINSIKAIQDVSATLSLRNGKTIVLVDASQVGELAVDAQEGTMTLRLVGTKGYEA